MQSFVSVSALLEDHNSGGEIEEACMSSILYHVHREPLPHPASEVCVCGGNVGKRQPKPQQIANHFPESENFFIILLYL